MRKFISLLLLAFFLISCGDKKPADQVVADNPAGSTAVSPNKIEGVEFGETKYIQLGKEMLSSFEKGDIDGWLTHFTDDTKNYLSSGDSLIGKKAINEYWTNRRKTIIDQLKFSEAFWLPINITSSQTNGRPGSWVFAWYHVDATYRNGKKIGFFVHTGYKFNENDKVDESWTFIDNAPIRAATAAK
jgi:hypothetical protein